MHYQPIYMQIRSLGTPPSVGMDHSRIIKTFGTAQYLVW